MDKTINIILEDSFGGGTHSIFVSKLDPSMRITSTDLNNLLMQKLKDHSLENTLKTFMGHHRTHLRLELDEESQEVETGDRFEHFIYRGDVSLILTNSTGSCVYCSNNSTAPNHGPHDPTDTLNNPASEFISKEEHALLNEFMRVVAKAKIAMKDQAKENALTIIKKLVRLAEQRVNMNSSLNIHIQREIELPLG